MPILRITRGGRHRFAVFETDSVPAGSARASRGLAVRLASSGWCTPQLNSFLEMAVGCLFCFMQAVK